MSTEQNNKIQRRNTSSELGKLPPSAVDVEEVVLGALMLERDAYLSISGFLRADSFYKDEHKEIYAAIVNLFIANKPVDLLSVVNELRRLGKLEFAGGPSYISALTDRVSSSANIEWHAMIVTQHYLKRQLINMCSEISQDAYDESTEVFDLLDKAGTILTNIVDIKGVRNVQQIFEIIVTVHAVIVDKKANPERVKGVILTGIEELDDILGGLSPGDFTILAGRPGMGKTSFALFIAKMVAKKYYRRVAIFSIEMTADQLGIKMMAPEVGVNPKDVKRGYVSDAEMNLILDMCGHMKEWGFFVDDTPSLTLLEFKAAVRKLKAKYGIEFIIIDYLQLMEGDDNGKKAFGSNREQEVSKISRGIKAVAKSEKIPVMALSQLSRDVEKRGGGKRPQLSDLRESGGIEQDADQVIFLHRPEYYGHTEGEDGMSLPKGYMEVIVAKNRHGETGNIELIADMPKMNFFRIEDEGTKNLVQAITSGKKLKKPEQKTLFGADKPKESIDPEEDEELPF